MYPQPRPRHAPALVTAEPLEPRTVLAAAPSLVYSFGNPDTSAPFHSGLATDKFGCVYITGSFDKTLDLNPDPAQEFILASSVGGSELDAFVAKYSPFGQLVWAYVYSAQGQWGGGGVWSPFLTVTPNGVTYLACTFAGKLDADPTAGTFPLETAYDGGTPEAEMAVIRIDPGGTFGGAAKFATRHQGVQPVGIATDAAGRVYVAADSFVPFKGGTYIADYDTLLYRLSPDLRQQQYAFRWGAKHKDVHPVSLAVNPDGSALIAGDTWTGVDFHPARRKVRTIPDGFQHRNDFLLRVNPAGQFDWVMGLQGPTTNTVEFSALAPDGQGGAYLAGRYVPGFDFNPARRRTFIPDTYENRFVDGFVARYSAGGAFSSFWNLGPAGDLYYPSSLAVDPKTGNLAVTGTLSTQTWDTDPTGGQRLTSRSSGTDFYATYTPAGDLLDAHGVEFTGYTISPGRTLLPAFDPDGALLLLGQTHLDSILTYAPNQPDDTITLPAHGVYLLKSV